MPILKHKYPFTEANIMAFAPEASGVYGLYNRSSFTIYYGRADKKTIKEKLLSHFNGKEGKCTQGAISCNSETYVDPTARQEQLLEEHKNIYGMLPKCNERDG